MNKIIKLGIIILIITGSINAILVNTNIEGIVREFARFAIVVGLAVLLFGLFWKGKNSKSK